MSDYIVYHNTEKRPHTIEEVQKRSAGAFEWFTDKPAEKAVDARVWMIVGTGMPRRYYLAGWFTPDSISKGGAVGFEWQLRGTRGKWLNPSKRIEFEPWFKDFKKKLGNFAFGLQPLTQPEFVRELEILAA